MTSHVSFATAQAAIAHLAGGITPDQGSSNGLQQAAHEAVRLIITSGIAKDVRGGIAAVGRMMLTPSRQPVPEPTVRGWYYGQHRAAGQQDWTAAVYRAQLGMIINAFQGAAS
jgi:hypothetical protein